MYTLKHIIMMDYDVLANDTNKIFSPRASNYYLSPAVYTWRSSLVVCYSRVQTASGAILEDEGIEHLQSLEKKSSCG